METADLIVIGSGQGGTPLASDYATAERKVVIFERDVLGGSCINYGCTPSKAFLAAAHSSPSATGREARKSGSNHSGFFDRDAASSRHSRQLSSRR